MNKYPGYRIRNFARWKFFEISLVRIQKSGKY